MRWWVVVGFLGLAACQTPAEMIEASRCESYGFSKGTAKFGDCMDRQADRRIRAATGLMAASAAFMEASRPVYVAPAPAEAVNITIRQPTTVCSPGPYGTTTCGTRD